MNNTPDNRLYPTNNYFFAVDNGDYLYIIRFIVLKIHKQTLFVINRIMMEQYKDSKLMMT